MNFVLANANTGQATHVFRSEHVFALVVHQETDTEVDGFAFFKDKGADFDWYEALKTAFKELRNALIVLVDQRAHTLYTLDIGHVARAHFFAGDECTKLFIVDADVRKVNFLLCFALLFLYSFFLAYFVPPRRRGVWCASRSRKPASQPSW